MSFLKYLSESEKTYKYRVKSITDLSESEVLDRIEGYLQRFKLIDISRPFKTILQKVPLDFPNVTNAEVFMLDIETAFPLSSYVAAQELRSLLGIPENMLVVRGANEPIEIETSILNQKQEVADAAEKKDLEPFFNSLPQAYDPFTVPGYTPGAGAPGNNYTQNPTSGFSSLLGLAATFLAPGGTSQITSAAKQIGSGVLGAFGTAVFGQNNPLSNAFSSALPGIMNGSFSLANTENALLRGVATNPNAALSALGNLGQNSIPAQTYSQSFGAISSFLSPGAPSSTGQGLAAAVTASAMASGSSPNDMVSQASAGVSYGLSLNSTAIGVVNQNSPSGAQIGVFTTNSDASNSGAPPSSDSIIV